VSTHEKLITIVEDLLITQSAHKILNHPDFEGFIDQKMVQDLKNIQNLFKIVLAKGTDLFNDFRVRWKKFIQKKGEEMLNDEDLAKKGFHAIDAFIDFRKSSVVLVQSVFPK